MKFIDFYYDVRVESPAVYCSESSFARKIKASSHQKGSAWTERNFSFKHKHTKQIVSFVLEHGSLLIMKDTTQTNWLHSLPKSKSGTQPRIYLTFQTIVH